MKLINTMKYEPQEVESISVQEAKEIHEELIIEAFEDEDCYKFVATVKNEGCVDWTIYYEFCFDKDNYEPTYKSFVVEALKLWETQLQGWILRKD